MRLTKENSKDSQIVNNYNICIIFVASIIIYVDRLGLFLRSAKCLRRKQVILNFLSCVVDI